MSQIGERFQMYSLFPIGGGWLLMRRFMGGATVSRCGKEYCI